MVIRKACTSVRQLLVKTREGRGLETVIHVHIVWKHFICHISNTGLSHVPYVQFNILQQHTGVVVTDGNALSENTY